MKQAVLVLGLGVSLALGCSSKDVGSGSGSGLDQLASAQPNPAPDHATKVRMLLGKPGVQNEAKPVGTKWWKQTELYSLVNYTMPHIPDCKVAVTFDGEVLVLAGHGDRVQTKDPVANFNKVVAVETIRLTDDNAGEYAEFFLSTYFASFQRENLSLYPGDPVALLPPTGIVAKRVGPNFVIRVFYHPREGDLLISIVIAGNGKVISLAHRVFVYDGDGPSVDELPFGATHGAPAGQPTWVATRRKVKRVSKFPWKSAEYEYGLASMKLKNGSYEQPEAGTSFHFETAAYADVDRDGSEDAVLLMSNALEVYVGLYAFAAADEQQVALLAPLPGGEAGVNEVLDVAAETDAVILMRATKYEKNVPTEMASERWVWNGFVFVHDTKAGVETSAVPKALQRSKRR